ncbi:uncharacterized protein LOC108629298 [Ceratina calcarata]|uniref:Uncharacterized protein LOC108629298 n=1 Tax=Ceratina calcarata TaxID=156304 RepID=A0AAJ7J8H1_9HYME|nr:uncharacterized protein LOC108629298 [Ceratina calcarata]
MVEDLSTQAFLAAVRRFFARKGKATDLYSDNATNFVGAKREIDELHNLIMSDEPSKIIFSTLASQNINWHFIPPRSPLFGGLWEAAVKSCKHHLIRVVGTTLLSIEAFLTYLVEIEDILNSRPILPLSSDPNDLKALNPGHFLIGEPLTSMPEHDLREIAPTRLACWEKSEQMRQHFWSRWYKEYLHTQTVKKKWHTGQPDVINIDTLVIMKEDNTPPMHWPLARITKIHPGADGIIRVVTVKTTTGEYKRSIKNLSPLPIDIK